MKIICIESQYDLDFTRQHLTSGKVYDVASTNHFKSKPGISHYRITNDDGQLQSFYHSMFETLREKNLREIL